MLIVFSRLLRILSGDLGFESGLGVYSCLILSGCIYIGFCSFGFRHNSISSVDILLRKLSYARSDKKSY